MSYRCYSDGEPEITDAASIELAFLLSVEESTQFGNTAGHDDASSQP